MTLRGRSSVNGTNLLRAPIIQGTHRLGRCPRTYCGGFGGGGGGGGLPFPTSIFVTPGRLIMGSTQDICRVLQVQARTLPVPHAGTTALFGCAPVALHEQVGGGVPGSGSATARDAVKHTSPATRILHAFISPPEPSPPEPSSPRSTSALLNCVHWANRPTPKVCARDRSARKPSNQVLLALQ